MQIKELRLSKNLTQLQLAKKLNVKRTTLTMWESGASQPNIDTLKRLSIIFNCSIDDLIKDKV